MISKIYILNVLLKSRLFFLNNGCQLSHVRRVNIVQTLKLKNSGFYSLLRARTIGVWHTWHLRLCISSSFERTTLANAIIQITCYSMSTPVNLDDEGKSLVVGDFNVTTLRIHLLDCIEHIRRLFV